MERYFILDKFNTWYDWRLILTAKDVTPPEPKINLVELDGMSGTLDLSESLSGEVTFKDRIITATFWTDQGSREDRERLLRDIRIALHGRKIKIIEPDDPDHYFYGRAVIKSTQNTLPYAEFTIEATCEPWRYNVNDTVRYISVNRDTKDLVICNNGAKTLSPVIEVTGAIDITYNGVRTYLTDGSYIISDVKLYRGVNVIKVSGEGSVSFTYKEADL
jgi:hypothetical protein